MEDSDFMTKKMIYRYTAELCGIYQYFANATTHFYVHIKENGLKYPWFSFINNFNYEGLNNFIIFTILYCMYRCSEIPLLMPLPGGHFSIKDTNFQSQIGHSYYI
jgi:hypothetical protein